MREGVIAAILVSLMILFFLGSWRSVLIVCTSIPLAIMCGNHRFESDRQFAEHHDARRTFACHRNAC